jgi:predicted ATP-grasp superfamily ATP-dependent carboligase
MPPARSPPSAAPGHDVIVVGASARAWSASAVRAGWRVHAVDLFADTDLVAIAASAIRLPHGYPHTLPAAVASLPAAPLTYTGGLENHPAVLAALSRDRLLAGVGPQTLPRVRGATALRRLARAAGMVFPETCSSPRGLPRDGSYLVKPTAGAGGIGIAPWTGTTPPPSSPAALCWQRLVRGRPCSATWVVADEGPRLVGVARQRLGPLRPGGPSFSWCGGVVLDARRLPTRVVAALHRLGAALWRIDGLRGIVGVDFVVTATGAAVLIEVNPRPTASAELHERQTGRALAGDHLACFGLYASQPACAPPPRAGCWAKALVRHHRALAIDGPLLARLGTLAGRWSDDDGGWPALADMPSPGDTLPAHGPVLTVFAHGPTTTAAGRALAARTALVRAAFTGGLPHDPVTRRAAAAPPPRHRSPRTA